MDSSNPVVEQIEGPVATVQLNREKQHNAFTPEMVSALSDSFIRLGLDKSVRVVILTGRGRSFCAGADLTSMRNAATQTDTENLADAEAIFDLMLTIDCCPLPVVGRINGTAVGGGVGLVSCCDFAVAVNRAHFGLSEVRLGLVPAVISPFVISKIGPSNARELFLSGGRIDAKRAREIGLVHYVVEEDKLDQVVEERVQELLRSAPGAVSAAKKLIRTVGGKSVEELRTYTTRLIAERRKSPEGREGMDAFLEKRDPWWREQ
ncbi:MAG TPA: enoyl-CoA hydratase-related protein [candidate division Zixibacteria bacterium]|nr:enoyl-CoA hydratase-related protein [candidate division Zixibacteria bacterium]